MVPYAADNLININLEYILQQLSKLMNKVEFCHCEICLDDICALTLAKLPPAYVTNLLDKESAFAKLDHAAIEALMMDVISKVKTAPHH